MAAPKRIQVPDGLKETLQDFVVSVLRNQVAPDDIRQYAAQYFANQIGMRLVSGNMVEQQAQHTASFVAGEPSSGQEIPASPLPAENTNITSQPENDTTPPKPKTPEPANETPQRNRQKSEGAAIIKASKTSKMMVQAAEEPTPFVEPESTPNDSTPPAPVVTKQESALRTAPPTELQQAVEQPETTSEPPKSDTDQSPMPTQPPTDMGMPAAEESAAAAVEEGENVYREENGLGMPPPAESYTTDPTAPTINNVSIPPGADEMNNNNAADNTNDQKQQQSRRSSKTIDRDVDGEAADGVADMKDRAFKPPVRGKARRQSVSAESYDPSKDDDAEKKLPVFPKSDMEMATLREAMKNALIFRSLDPNQLGKVADAVRPVIFEAGQTVIKEGDENANDFYVIESGVLDIFKTIDGQEKYIGSYDNSGAFGELALLYNQPRAATIKCKTDAKLWALDRQTFQIIVVRAAYKKRQLYMEIMDRVDFLSELTSFEKQNVCDALRPKYFPTMDTNNDVIMKQGDDADGMYFIEEGTCKVTIHNKTDASADAAAAQQQQQQQEDKEISTLNRGDYFGELALITKNKRAATVKADGKVKLAFLDTGAFERLCGPCVDVMRRNIDKYEQQLNGLGMQIKLQ